MTLTAGATGVAQQPISRAQVKASPVNLGLHPVQKDMARIAATLKRARDGQSISH